MIPANGGFTPNRHNGLAKSEVAANAESTAALLDDIAEMFRRYVIFRSEHEPYALAAQVLYTYVWENNGDYLFWVTLYVLIIGKPGSAKTRLLELVNELVRNPTPIGVRWTEANLFRVAQENRVIFMDETHNSMGGPEDKGITSVLNAGNRLTGEVPRVNPKTGETEWYRVFCPKWIAAREDKHSLSDDTLERTVKIRLPKQPNARKTLGVRLNLAEFRSNEGKRIHARAETWAASARERMPGISDVSVPDEMEDRAAEAWLPLFAICDLAGDVHGKRIRNAALQLTGSDSMETSGEIFDVAVRLAMHRGYVSPSDYSDTNLSPFDGEHYGGLVKSDYGWNDRRKAFKHLSIYASNDRSVIRLHIPGKGQEFDLFWQAVKRANNGTQLPEAQEILTQLKLAGRLTPEGRKGFKYMSRVWKTDKDRVENYTIDIRCWYENDVSASPDEPSYKVQKLAEIITANNYAEINAASGPAPNPWKDA